MVRKEKKGWGKGKREVEKIKEKEGREGEEK